ncbi:hypothetical protein C8R44DRAFT_863124 [Mycena epipterygia]|nr:hypothetical protein C8R44DRAFT_863124 [Mycena epipterygia]
MGMIARLGENQHIQCKERLEHIFQITDELGCALMGLGLVRLSHVTAEVWVQGHLEAEMNSARARRPSIRRRILVYSVGGGKYWNRTLYPPPGTTYAGHISGVDPCSQAHHGQAAKYQPAEHQRPNARPRVRHTLPLDASPPARFGERGREINQYESPQHTAAPYDSLPAHPSTGLRRKGTRGRGGPPRARLPARACRGAQLFARPPRIVRYGTCCTPRVVRSPATRIYACGKYHVRGPILDAENTGPFSPRSQRKHRRTPTPALTLSLHASPLAMPYLRVHRAMAPHRGQHIRQRTRGCRRPACMIPPANIDAHPHRAAATHTTPRPTTRAPRALRTSLRRNSPRCISAYDSSPRAAAAFSPVYDFRPTALACLQRAPHAHPHACPRNRGLLCAYPPGAQNEMNDKMGTRGRGIDEEGDGTYVDEMRGRERRKIAGGRERRIDAHAGGERGLRVIGDHEAVTTAQERRGDAGIGIGADKEKGDKIKIARQIMQTIRDANAHGQRRRRLNPRLLTPSLIAGGDGGGDAGPSWMGVAEALGDKKRRRSAVGPYRRRSAVACRRCGRRRRLGARCRRRAQSRVNKVERGWFPPWVVVGGGGREQGREASGADEPIKCVGSTADVAGND